MFDRKQFEEEKLKNIEQAHKDQDLHAAALQFIAQGFRLGYGHNWTWLDMPIIQMPEDVVLVQEIIWKTKPDLIIETGVAWGGSIVLYASLLELIGNGQVIGIEQVLPEQNIAAIMNYKFSNRIKLFAGSSTDLTIFAEVNKLIQPNSKVMVLLDSNHTHEHVYNELQLWSGLVTPGCYLIVSDTIVEEIAEHRVRPWGVGNNPKTAMDQFLTQNNRFNKNNYYNKKTMCSFSRTGYLECI